MSCWWTASVWSVPLISLYHMASIVTAVDPNVGKKKSIARCEHCFLHVVLSLTVPAFLFGRRTTRGLQAAAKTTLPGLHAFPIALVTSYWRSIFDSVTGEQLYCFHEFHKDFVVVCDISPDRLHA